MGQTSKLVVFVDTDKAFLERAKEFSTKRGLIVRTVTNINDIFVLLKDICKKIDVIAIDIDQYNIEELKKLKENLINLDCKKAKILSITGPASKFSGVTIEKIKALTPIDLINKDQNTEQMLFRVVNAIFSDSPKRRSPRIIVDFPVKCTSEEMTFDAMAFSLSKNGIFIKTDNALEPNSFINLRFKLPGDESDFDLQCKVLYDIKAEQQAFQIAPTGVGLFFHRINPADQDKIAKFVKDRS